MFKVCCSHIQEPIIVETYNEAVDKCWRLCYERIDFLLTNEIILLPKAQMAMTAICKKFKELKEEPRNTDEFMLFGYIYCSFEEV